MTEKKNPKEIKLCFDRMGFEITRQCNLQCAHCARGEAQDKVIKKEYIDRVLDQIECVGDINLTGGEPGLYPELIEYVVDGIIRRGIKVQHFQMTTNGTIRDERIAASFDKIGDWCAKWRTFILDRCDLEHEKYVFNMGCSLIRISSDIFHRDFEICKPEETLNYYKSACKSENVKVEMTKEVDSEDNSKPYFLRKTGRSAVMSEENIKRGGVKGWSIGCPYQRFGIEKILDRTLIHVTPDSDVEHDDFDRKWITGGVDILTNGGFLKTTFDDYSKSDELGVDNVMEYSLVECIARWNRRFPFYKNEADTLYRTLMNSGLNGIIDREIAQKEAEWNLRMLRKLRLEILEAIPNVPFDMLAEATFEPFEKRVNLDTTQKEYEDSFKKMETRINMMLAVYRFYPPAKEPHTYDELMNWLKKH